MKPVRPTADIRRRLLAGEPLTAAQVVSDYGASHALLGSVLKILRGEGETIDATLQPGTHGTHVYRVQGVSEDPRAWGKARGVQKLSGDRPPLRTESPIPERHATPPARRTKRNGVALPSLPSLGGDVRVCLLAVDDDGRVSIGLRSDAGTWLTTVEGFSATK